MNWWGVLMLLIVPNLQAQDSLNKTICLGGSVTLEIPDCEGGMDCCVTWKDPDSSEALNVVSRGCTYTVVDVMEDKTFNITITKDNLGTSEQLTASVKVVSPEELNVSVLPEHMCYSKDDVLLSNEFQIVSSYPELALEIVSIVPANAPFFNKQVSPSTHDFYYVCKEGNLPVSPVPAQAKILVINSDYVNPYVGGGLNFDTFLSKLGTVIERSKIAFACGPYIDDPSGGVTFSNVAYCCKNVDPIGEFVEKNAYSIAFSSEIGIKCGRKLVLALPFTNREIASASFFFGVGVDVSATGSVTPTCDTGSKYCIEVATTPRVFATGTVDQSLLGHVSIAIEGNAELTLPVVTMCVPDFTFQANGPMCFSGNITGTVTFNSFFFNFMNINFRHSSCSQ